MKLYYSIGTMTTLLFPTGQTPQPLVVSFVQIITTTHSLWILGSRHNIFLTTWYVHQNSQGLLASAHKIPSSFLQHTISGVIVLLLKHYALRPLTPDLVGELQVFGHDGY